MTLAHEEPSGPVAAPRRRSSPVILLLEWILVVAAAIGTAVLIRTYVAQTFYIPSASMSPTLRVDDRIVIDKVTYRFRDPHRGDIVVFRGPPRTQLAGIDLVKRVVGLPGDRVAAVDGRIEVNDQVAHIGQRVSHGDRIKVAGRPIKVRIAPQPARILAYHKPVGEVVTHDDPQGRPTVFRR
ncbi:MAG: signal peptidase I, partial [Actinomycetota bacterium]